jgi:hypothetical protein
MRNLGSSYRIYPDIADSFADFVALSVILPIISA